MNQKIPSPVTASSQMEYVLYTFESNSSQANHLTWKKQSVTSNKLSALSAGQKLSSINKYKRIELHAHNKITQTVIPIYQWERASIKARLAQNLTPVTLLFLSGFFVILALVLLFFVYF